MSLEHSPVINYDQEIAVIGGSLVGPLTEQLFRASGFENVTTYEAAPKSRPQAGGMLGLDHTAYPALQKADISLAEVTASGTNIVTAHNITPHGFTGQAKHSMYFGFNTTWDVFHQAVGSRTDIKYGNRVQNVSTDGDKAVVHFKDESTTTADLVVFADGRRSIGRAALAPSREFEYQGYVVWRGTNDATTHTPDNFTRYSNPEDGVLFVASDPIIRGAQKGKSDWALYQNISAPEFRELTGAEPHTKSYMFPHQVTPEMREYMEQYARASLPEGVSDVVLSSEDIMMVPMNDVTRPEQAVWKLGENGRAVLVGDALMPVRPHTARGLNNGIENAHSLVKTVATDGSDAGFRQWEDEALSTLSQWQDIGKVRAHSFGLGGHLEI